MKRLTPKETIGIIRIIVMLIALGYLIKFNIELKSYNDRAQQELNDRRRQNGQPPIKW